MKKKILKLAEEQRENFIKKKKKSRLVDHARPKMNPGHNGIIFSLNLLKVCYPRILSPTNGFCLRMKAKYMHFQTKKELEFHQKNLLMSLLMAVLQRARQ